MSFIRRHGWAPAVFFAALGLRVGFLLLVDQPLLYTHQYTYFTGALRLAQHESPWHYLLHSDEWRAWDVHWTIAPLYFVFVGGLLRLLDGALLPLQLVQCGLDALVALLVALLGRRLAGVCGAWAGAAYAVYWTAVELPSWTMTENLHTPLLAAGVVLAAGAGGPAGQTRGRLFLAGVVVGLSALVRSVSTGFLLLLGAWQIVRHGRKDGLRRGSILVAGGLLMILPWTARNVLLMGEPVPIETTVYENILYANHLGTPEEYEAALRQVGWQPTPAAKRALALRLGLEGVLRHPDRFVEKVRQNFWHFIRPEGLDGLLRVERSVEPWGHLRTFLGDDLLLLAGLPLFLVFVLAGRASPTRDVILLWSAYYLFLVIVVFHNEVRYRSALAPFALAAAAGGGAILCDPQQRRQWRTRLGLALGVALVAATLWPYLPLAWRAARGLAAARDASVLAEQGDVAGARALLEQSAPKSAWPWTLHARRLTRRGQWDGAMAAYEAAIERATPVHYAPRLALPRAAAEADRRAKSMRATRAADELSWVVDPWLMLELAWAELPPPATDEIALGAGTNDYGAVRGFLHPRGDRRLHRAWNDYALLGGLQPPPGPHRWSRAHAKLRLVPRTTAPRYDVTLWMGSPFPSPLAAPVATVLVEGAAARFTLGRDIRPYTLRARAPHAGEPLVVTLRSPTWNRVGEPAQQGVRVDRLTLTPAP